MIVILILLLILGLFTGSFLGVLIDRLPRGESVFKGRSYCESCKKILGFFDLIPLLSFVLLRGKCRYCKTKISYYYPIVELATGFLFVFTANSILNNFQFSIFNFQLNNIASLLYYLIIVSSLNVIFFTDLKYGIIPDRILFPSIIISLIYLILNTSSIILFLFSAFSAFAFFFILFLITKGKGMGLGDVKLVFLMGIFLGFPKILVALYLSFLIGAAVSIFLIVLKKKKFFGGKIPFGPFLVLSTYISLFMGESIVKIVVLSFF